MPLVTEDQWRAAIARHRQLLANRAFRWQPTSVHCLGCSQRKWRDGDSWNARPHQRFVRIGGRVLAQTCPQRPESEPLTEHRAAA